MEQPWCWPCHTNLFSDIHCSKLNGQISISAHRGYRALAFVPIGTQRFQDLSRSTKLLGRLQYSSLALCSRCMPSQPGSSAAKRQPQQRLLLLDIFGTLLQPRMPPAHQYAAVSRFFGLPITDASAQKAFKVALKHMNALHPNYGRDSGLAGGAETWWTQIVQATITQGIVNDELVGSICEAEQLYHKFNHNGSLVKAIFRRFESADAYMLFPDVEPFLKQLQEITQTRCGGQLTVALASNSDGRILQACKTLGLDQFVDCSAAVFASEATKNSNTEPAIGTADDATNTGKSFLYQAKPSPVNGFSRGAAALSYDVGHAKPASEFFHSVLRLHRASHQGEASAKVYYVGDDFEEDAVGAARAQADITGIWLDRSNSEKTSERLHPEGHFQVIRVSSLMDVLKCIT